MRHLCDMSRTPFLTSGWHPGLRHSGAVTISRRKYGGLGGHGRTLVAIFLFAADTRNPKPRKYGELSGQGATSARPRDTGGNGSPPPEVVKFLFFDGQFVKREAILVQEIWRAERTRCDICGKKGAAIGCQICSGRFITSIIDFLFITLTCKPCMV